MSETMTKEELERKLKIDEDLKTMQTWSEEIGYDTVPTLEESMRQSQKRMSRVKEAYRGYEELSGKTLATRISGEKLPDSLCGAGSISILEVTPANESRKQKKKRLNEIEEAQKECEGATHLTYEMHTKLTELNAGKVELDRNRDAISRFNEESGVSLESAAIFMKPVNRDKKGRPKSSQDKEVDAHNQSVMDTLLSKEETADGVNYMTDQRKSLYDGFVAEAREFVLDESMLQTKYITEHMNELVTSVKKWEAINELCLGNEAYVNTLTLNERAALKIQIEISQQLKIFFGEFVKECGVTLDGEYLERVEKDVNARDGSYTKLTKLVQTSKDKYVDSLVENYSDRIATIRADVEEGYDNSSIEGELKELRDTLAAKPEVYEQKKESFTKAYQAIYQTTDILAELEKEESVFKKLYSEVQITESASASESAMKFSPQEAIAQKIAEITLRKESVKESIQAYKAATLYIAGIGEYSSSVMVGIGRMGLEKEFFEKKLDTLKLEKRRTGGRFNPNPEGVDTAKYRTTVAGWVKDSDSLAPQLIPYKERIIEATDALERARQENRPTEEIEALESELKKRQIEYNTFCPTVYGKIDFRGDNNMGRMEVVMDGVSLDLRRDLVEYSLLLGENLPLEDIVAQSRKRRLSDTSPLTFYDGPGMDLIVDKMFDMIAEQFASEEFLKFMKMQYDLIKDAKVFQDDKMLAVKLIMKNEVNRRVASFSSELLPVLREKNLKLEPEKMKTINKFIGMASKCIATVYGAVDGEDNGDEIPEQLRGMVAKYNAMCRRVFDYAAAGDSAGSNAAQEGN